MRVSGSITRRIGRLDSDASPPMTVLNGCAASSPASRRIDVPELAASSGPAGARRPPSPSPSIVTAAGRARDAHAEALEAGQRRGAVGARRVAGEVRRAVGDGGEHRVAVRNRLVAGDAQASGDTRGLGEWRRNRWSETSGDYIVLS